MLKAEKGFAKVSKKQNKEIETMNKKQKKERESVASAQCKAMEKLVKSKKWAWIQNTVKEVIITQLRPTFMKYFILKTVVNVVSNRYFKYFTKFGQSLAVCIVVLHLTARVVFAFSFL